MDTTTTTMDTTTTTTIALITTPAKKEEEEAKEDIPRARETLVSQEDYAVPAPPHAPAKGRPTKRGHAFFTPPRGSRISETPEASPNCPPPPKKANTADDDDDEDEDDDDDEDDDEDEDEDDDDEDEDDDDDDDEDEVDEVLTPVLARVRPPVRVVDDAVRDAAVKRKKEAGEELDGWEGYRRGDINRNA
jgi:hypothetical protein